MNDIDPKVASQAADLVTQAKTFVITCDEHLREAGERLRAVKGMRKIIQAEIAPGKAAARTAWQYWIDLENKHDGPLEQVEMLYKAVSAKYLQDQERARLAEQQRLEALARAEEEKKRKAEVRALKKSGDTAAATSLAAAPLPPVIVAPPVAAPKVEGVQTRKVFRFEIEDASKLDRALLMPDEVKIRKLVNALGEAAIGKYPGLRVWTDTQVAVKA